MTQDDSFCLGRTHARHVHDIANWEDLVGDGSLFALWAPRPTVLEDQLFL